MVDAVLAGDGLGARGRAGRRGGGRPGGDRRAAARRGGGRAGRATAGHGPRCARYVADRADATARRRCPTASSAEVPIASGDERRRRACCCCGRRRAGAEAAEFLHLAAVASLTEVAVEEAKEEVEQNLRGSFLEELRSRADARAGARSCAAPARLGLRPLARRGRAVRRARRPSGPRHVVATIARRAPGRAGPAHATDRGLRAAAGRRRRRRAGGDAGGRAALAGAAAAPRHRRRCRRFYADPAELRARGPGGRAGARRPAPVRRADRRGHRHRAPTGCCSACWRRTPRRCARSTRTRSRRSSRYDDQYAHRSRRHARGLPRAELQHERDRGGDLRAPPHGRLPARARAAS